VLGVNLQTLSDCIFLPSNATHAKSATDRLENFVSVLYSQLLQSLTYLMNRLVLVNSVYIQKIVTVRARTHTHRGRQTHTEITHSYLSYAVL